MQQHPPIFEPLFSFQAPSMELLQETPAHDQAFISPTPSVLQLPPRSWFSKTNSPAISACTGGRRASCSHLPIFNDQPPMLSSNMTMHANVSSCSGIKSQQSDNVCKANDDGSVASKLLSSITKSISSPSLQLASSKEAARETPYQKSLKLKHLKLQHCAEALGMESSDSSSTCTYDMISRSLQQEKLDMIETLSSFPPVQPKTSNQEYSLTSVKSAPNLSTAPPVRMTSQSPKYTRCASFPPPLSHTLPASSSCDSLSVSLRPCREDGRFILKEVMVPSKHYFHVNRSDGRLTLHVLTREDSTDEENLASQYHNQGLSSEADELEDIMVKEEHSEKKRMISFTTATEDVGGCGDNEAYIMCNNSSQVQLVEDIAMEANVNSAELVMDHFKELPLAAKMPPKDVQGVATRSDRIHTGVAGSFLNLKRVQCIASHGINDPQGKAKSNFITNVIALSMQTTSHSTFTLHKAHVLSSFHPSSCSLISSLVSTPQSTLINPPGKSLGMPSSHHNLSSFPQSKENFIWESNLMPCVPMRHGYGQNSVARAEAASAFVTEDNISKSLMRMVAELATVGVSGDGSDWCSATVAERRRQSLTSLVGSKLNTEDDNNIAKTFSDDEDSSNIIEAFSALSDIFVGAGVSGNEEYIANSGGIVDTQYGFNHHDEERASMCIEAGKEDSISSFDPYLPSASSPPTAAYMQSDEWLNTLHCKELSDRNRLGICFMKPHCIATRS